MLRYLVGYASISSVVASYNPPLSLLRLLNNVGNADGAITPEPIAIMVARPFTSPGSQAKPSTLTRLESAGWGVAPGFASTVDRVVAVLEAQGVEFIELGVRLTKRPR
jgi:hypothetical protein